MKRDKRDKGNSRPTEVGGHFDFQSVRYPMDALHCTQRYELDLMRDALVATTKGVSVRTIWTKGFKGLEVVADDIPF